MRRSKYEGIGRNGTAEQFLRALQAPAGSRFYSSANKKMEALSDGAAAAFHESRPENIQHALQNLKSIEFGSGLGKGYPPYLVASLLHKLSEKSSDKKAAIELALAKTPEQDKKDILNQALLGAVRYESLREEFFITALLQAGADANAVCDGEAGGILANAASGGSMSVIKLLDENGASFTDAISFLSGHGWTSSIEKLRLYKETMRDNPPIAETDVWRQEMQEQVRELAGKVDRLSSLMEAFLEANQSREMPPLPNPKPSLIRLKKSP